jgi:hypothetical protein
MSETNIENISASASHTARAPRGARGGARGARGGARAPRGGARAPRAPTPSAVATSLVASSAVATEPVASGDNASTQDATSPVYTNTSFRDAAARGVGRAGRGRKPATQESTQETNVAPPVREVQAEQRKEDTEEKQVRPSRTIWVQSQSKEIDSRVFSGLAQGGLIDRQEHNKGYFLSWDTLENASTGFTTLREAGYSPRYKFYKLYFTMAGTNGSEDYGTLKSDFTSHLESTCNVKVQFCKFYRKDGKLMGGGDLSLDTLDGYNDLVSSKSLHKNYKFGNYSGTFYKFNSKNDKRAQRNH